MLLGAVEVVEHREEALRHRALGALELDLALLLGAATVVGVLRLQALEVVQQLRLEVGEHGVFSRGIRVLRSAQDVVDRELVVIAGRAGGALRGRLRSFGLGETLVAAGSLGLLVISGVLLRHDYFFSSSSSMTSASTTSSSGFDDAFWSAPSDSPEGADSDADCAAWFDA